MSETIRVSRELLENIQREMQIGIPYNTTAEKSLRALLSQPAEQQCKTCGGTCCVPDGTITHHADGTPFVNGPIKVVKNCPDCTAEQQDDYPRTDYELGYADGVEDQPTANARYTAKVRGSRIDMTAPELPLELNQMIVWIMHNQNAHYLLPRYREIREIDEREAEGSAKNHGLEV